MNEALTLVFALVTGIFLGALFFGGLWWTIQKGMSSNIPAVWFAGSLILRLSLVVTGFFLIGRHHWDRLAACVLGFLIARLIVTRLIHISKTSHQLALEVSNAPHSR